MKGLSPVHTRRVIRVMLVATAVLTVFVVRVVTSAAAELRRGDHYLEEGDRAAAVVHYRRAARWYAPGSPYHARALNKLAALGAAAEREGDAELALSAYRAVRAAIMSARSFYIPHREKLRAANERIATLMAAQPRPPMDAGKSADQLRREHLALLEADPGPDTLWTVVLLVGFATWVGGVFLLGTRGIDAEDRWITREAWRWGGVAAAGFALFVLGMSFA